MFVCAGAQCVCRYRFYQILSYPFSAKSFQCPKLLQHSRAYLTCMLCLFIVKIGSNPNCLIDNVTEVVMFVFSLFLRRSLLWDGLILMLCVTEMCKTRLTYHRIINNQMVLCEKHVFDRIRTLNTMLHWINIFEINDF